MSSHTPGPWIVTREGLTRQRIQTAGDKGTLCYMTARPFAHGGNFSHEQITDNARLIAAAPELLAALEALIPMVEEFAVNPELDRARMIVAIAKGEA